MPPLVACEELLRELAVEERELVDLLQQVRAKKESVRRKLQLLSGPGADSAPPEQNAETFTAALTARGSFLLDVPTLLKLKRFDTPTVSNGLELITRDREYGHKGFSLERVIDHMPDWGTCIGYAITVKIQPSDRKRVNACGANRQGFANYVASLEAALPPHAKCLPRIVVVEDLDVTDTNGKYCYGSMWGEVNANFFSKMGVKGCLCDGAVRDLPEMQAAGFRAFSRMTSPSHSFGGVPLEWDVPVDVFGARVLPGDLVMADRHGFQIIPRDMETKILEAAENGDKWERDFTIEASFAAAGTTYEEVNERMRVARGKFGKAKNDMYGSFAERMGADWADN